MHSRVRCGWSASPAKLALAQPQVAGQRLEPGCRVGQEPGRPPHRRVGPLLTERGPVALDPDAAGETYSPLDDAPLPDSLARRLFDAETIAAHLDLLASGQREDGGGTFNWPAWSPVAEREWRGSVTVDALRVLRANGRPLAAAAGAGAPGDELTTSA